ncbi:hypothetical protein Sbs19_16700 [Sphingobium sp. BS19]|nr:hypothetical protein Sbs19_16700 [Sphingobium sp. BS19]
MAVVDAGVVVLVLAVCAKAGYCIANTIAVAVANLIDFFMDVPLVSICDDIGDVVRLLSMHFVEN